MLREAKTTGCQGYISGRDKSLCSKKAAQNERLEQADRRRQRAAAEYPASFSKAQNEDSDSASESPSDSDLSDSSPPLARIPRARARIPHPRVKIPCPQVRGHHSSQSPMAAAIAARHRDRNVYGPQLVARLRQHLDRTQISDRQETHSLVLFAAKLGHNVTNLSLSVNCIRTPQPVVGSVRTTICIDPLYGQWICTPQPALHPIQGPWCAASRQVDGKSHVCLETLGVPVPVPATSSQTLDAAWAQLRSSEKN